MREMDVFPTNPQNIKTQLGRKSKKVAKHREKLVLYIFLDLP